MLLRTHVTFGLLIGLLSLKYLNIPNVYIFLALTCFASAIPDIDKSESRIGKKIRIVSWLIEKTFGHRNMLHSIFPLVIMYFIFFYFLKWNVAGIAMITGYASHLFIDMFNYVGIGLLYPLYKKRVTGFIKVGGITEHIIFFMLVFANILVILFF